MNELINNGAIYKLIEEELKQLPGEESHIEMIPFRLQSSLSLTKDVTPRLSAVLCLLYQNHDDIHIVLMERQNYGGTHSGQISFPGGKKENEDSTLIDTALRETEEEIGIERHKVNLLGKLTNVYIPVSNFLVEPYVGWIEAPNQFNLSEREVKTVFNIKFSELLNPLSKTKKNVITHKGHTLKNVPCFYIEERIIWGATSLMLNELKHLLERFKT